MALKHLELSEMVGLTGSWVGEHRKLLEQIPQAAPWVPQLVEAHNRVTKAQPVSTSEVDAQVAAITSREVGIDARHDDLMRATSLLLEAEQCACRASEPPRLERAATCERAATAVLPRGLLVVNSLYVAEAGNAARTRALLASEPWLRELLASLPITGGTALSVVESWCSLAEELGRLEEQKAALLASAASTPQVPRSELLAARNAWLALVNIVLTVLEMVEGHEHAVETLRAPVLRTAEIAGKRHAKQGGDEADPDVAPADPTTPAAPAEPATPAAPVAPGFPGAKPFA